MGPAQAEPRQPVYFHQRIGCPRRAADACPSWRRAKLVARDAATLQRLQDENLIALQYTHPETGEATQEHPWNPNGSPLAIAGLTDPTGHILGLMPHPEAFHHATNHPGWTRGEVARAPEPHSLRTLSGTCARTQSTTARMRRFGKTEELEA